MKKRRFRVSFSLPLLHLFAADVVDADAEHLDGFAGGGDFVVDHFLGGVVFHRELLQGMYGKGDKL